jgi:hypothetical protein
VFHAPGIRLRPTDRLSIWPPSWPFWSSIMNLWMAFILPVRATAVL